jgi:hypothetical protein
VKRYNKKNDTLSLRRAVTPLKIDVDYLRNYSSDTENAQLFAVVCATEKWFSIDGAGRFLHKAPSVEHNPNPAFIATLRNDWIHLKTQDRPLYAGDKLDAYAPGLFNFKEIEEAALHAAETFLEDGMTLTMQYRVLAARIIEKLPRPFAREDDEKVLADILRNRRMDKIDEQLPFHQLKEHFPDLVRVLQLDGENYWEKITNFCRHTFHILFEWMEFLAKYANRRIPSELLFLLETPESLVTFDEEQVPEDFQRPASINSSLVEDDEEQVSWLLFKAKNLMIAAIPKTLVIRKAEAAKKIVDHLISLSNENEIVVQLARQLEAAAATNDQAQYDIEWAKFRKYVEEQPLSDTPHLHVTEYAAKKTYSAVIVENVTRIMQMFDTTKVKETLYRFSITFGPKRVCFFDSERRSPPAWPYTTFVPQAQQWPKITPNREDIFKSGEINRNDPAMGTCVMKHCQKKRDALFLCGFCLSALTDIIPEKMFSAIAPVFGEMERSTPAYERWNTKIGWIQATVRNRLRFFREVALLNAVETDDETSYKPSVPEPVIKNLMAVVGTGTRRSWQDAEVRLNEGLLHAAEYLYLRFEGIEKDYNWITVKEQTQGAAIFCTVDNPSFRRTYSEVIITGRTAGGETFLMEEEEIEGQDRVARLLQNQRRQIREILDENLPCEENSCPEIEKLAAMQLEQPLVKIVLVCKSQHVFERYSRFVKSATGNEELGLTLLVQEKLDADSPWILKWATAKKSWLTLRPIVGKMRREMPPSTKKEPSTWSFLLDAVVDLQKLEGFCPENLIGSLSQKFVKPIDWTMVKRQKKALDIAIAIEGWSSFDGQNKMELLDHDFKPETVPEGEGMEITPEDILPMFMESKNGWEVQDEFRQRVFGRATNLPFTANLGPYNFRNWEKADEETVEARSRKTVVELTAAGISPDFDGLTADDVEALLMVRRAFDHETRIGTMLGLGVTLPEDPDFPEEWRNDFQIQRDEGDLTDEELFFSYLPRRLHHAVDWEVEARRRARRDEERILHPEVVRAMSEFNLIESAGASIHPRFRGWMALFRGTKPDWHAKVEPFGIPTLNLLEEFSKRIDFHTDIFELAGGIKKLSFQKGVKKTKRGRKVRVKKWEDNRIGALLPEVPQTIWRKNRFVYVPIVDVPWPPHAREGDSENIGERGKGRFNPRPWADMLNEAIDEKYRNMWKIGIKKESQVLDDGKADQLSVEEKANVAKWAANISKIGLDALQDLDYEVPEFCKLKRINKKLKVF